MKSKKAAIGAAMTWIVATIIILLVIILFVYGSGLLKTSSKTFKSSPFNIAPEQTLLALLETKLDEKTVKDYILEGKYKELEKKIKPILEKLPENSFEIRENGVLVSNVGPFIALSASEDRTGGYASSLYLDKNKKIDLTMRYIKK